MKKLFVAFAMIASFAACESDVAENETGEQVGASSMRIGDENPFTVDNMKIAHTSILKYYASIGNKDMASKFKDYQVNATHIYYKLKPADSTQYKSMIADENIDISTTPFGEGWIEKDGAEADVKDNAIPEFYALAEASHKMPEDVPSEKLAELHFTNEDSLPEDATQEIEFLLNMTYESRLLAGHLDKEEIADGYFDFSAPDPDARLFPKKWRPSGRLQLEEGRLTAITGNKFFVPIKGARVNMLKWGWMQVEHGYTDNNGNFSGGTTYTKHITYNVKFKHDFCVVKEGNFYDTANHKSDSKNRQPWIHNFTEGGRSHFYAMVYNASWEYYFKHLQQHGLWSPGIISISAKYNGQGSNAGADWWPLNSTIRVSRLKSGGSYRNSDGIYGTTTHEMTHTGHRKVDAGMFSLFHNGNKERLLMQESWAEGVETIVTTARYRALLPSYTGSFAWNTAVSQTRGWNGEKQLETVNSMNEYTPMVIDLYDTYNQRNYPNQGPFLPQDRVSGYTIAQMQAALNNSRTLVEWRNKLVNNYNNPTENLINDVFDYAITAMHNL